MKHEKVYHSYEMLVEECKIVIEGPVSPEELSLLGMHHQLTAFRQPEQQQEALTQIALREEGRIIIARKNETIVGYVTFSYPDPIERWSQGDIHSLIELGAIEVAPPFRATGVGSQLLKVAFLDPFMESYIVISTEYYWHWDLKGTNLNVWEYRKVMEKVMGSVGLLWCATDDPEICSHPANCLMVRIGKNVSMDDIMRFERLRLQRRYMF